jgi:hypothetical protein
VPHLRVRANARRAAMLRPATDLVAHVPARGEAVHALITGKCDLMMVVSALLAKFGAAEHVRIATLSFNGRNLQEVFALADTASFRRLTLICSSFFRDHNPDLWQGAVEGFRERGHTLAAVRNHAKVVTLCWPGRKLVIEGSANLRTNGNMEQVAFIADDRLQEWHAAWIDEAVRAYEGSDDGEKPCE